SLEERGVFTVCCASPRHPTLWNASIYNLQKTNTFTTGCGEGLYEPRKFAEWPDGTSSILSYSKDLQNY
ncbi:MAG: hypothetical protein KBC60_06310, partial [Haliscomenobacter sp.]|nr:hypothetical protein [Haliscomenobacter sp.]